MTLGIPRALLYYKYRKFWEALFELLKINVVYSPHSTAQLLNAGLKFCTDESCLPLKLFYGHVLYLKDRVDALFIPRFVSTKKGTHNCPKYIGLPDMIKNTIPNLPPIIAPLINYNREPIYITLVKICLKLKRFWAITSLWHIINLVDDHFPPISSDGDVKVLLLAHPYNLYDSFCNFNLIDFLKKSNVKIITLSQLPKTLLTQPLSFPQYWDFAEEFYNAFRFAKGYVDGVISITSFGCGPDSLMNELFIREAKENKLPYLQLVVDEHTSNTAIITRVEAFLEMLRRC